MSKRKRSEELADGDGTETNFRQQRRIVSAFSNGADELVKAFKLARGFERQKLGRRKKNAAANNDEKDMQRIDAEVAALKTLDIASCAQHHLSKSLLKIKAIATSPHLPSELRRPTPLSTDPAVLNVNARLCNSNPVKDAFPKLIEHVKSEFGIEEKVGAPAKKQRLRAKDHEDPELERTERVYRVRATESSANYRPPRPTRSATTHQDVRELEELSDEDLDQYAYRIASSDDEESDSINKSSDGKLDTGSNIEELERQLEAEGISRKAGPTKRQPYNHAAGLSLSEDELEEESSEEEPRKATVTKKSSFIPSLTLGGYISGSGSDIDDVDVAPKKNRRGQRARQQIWEKKYGQRAKHIQNQERTKGWDPKRGAVGDAGKAGKKGPRSDRFAKGANMEKLGQSRRAPTNDAKKPPRKDDSGPLHPSWEAAKRAKEKKSVPVAFQGKKISFD